MAAVPISNNLVLELHVPNFQSERDFYKTFGFEQTYYDPTSGGGSELGYMVLTRKDEIGDTRLHFYGDGDRVYDHAGFNNFPADTPRGFEVEITIPVSDVEGLWNFVSSKLDEKIISQPLTTKRWSKRDFRVIDPFGFYVRFTELVDWGQEAGQEF